MEEILKKNQELKAQKEREQKIIDDAYCQLIQKELENEKYKLHGGKVNSENCIFHLFYKVNKTRPRKYLPSHDKTSNTRHEYLAFKQILTKRLLIV